MPVRLHVPGKPQFWVFAHEAKEPPEPSAGFLVDLLTGDADERHQRVCMSVIERAPCLRRKSRPSHRQPLKRDRVDSQIPAVQYTVSRKNTGMIFWYDRNHMNWQRRTGTSRASTIDPERLLSVKQLEEKY